MRAVLVILISAVACSRPISTAWTTPIQPPSPQEIEAERKLATRHCSVHLAWLFPGLGQLCINDTGKGAALMGTATAEFGAMAAIARSSDQGLSHPANGLVLVGLQDLWVYGISDAYMTRRLANRRVYTPTDSMTDLVAAPFNVQVMKRPGVWGGLLVALAVGIGASIALEGGVDTDNVGDDPNIFGEQFSRETGYPLGFGLGVGLFTHVGVAEEALFRGVVQSDLAAMSTETQGWLAGSLIFGVAHAPNALALEGEDQKNYLLYGLPVITVLGSYLGWLYKESDYSLAPSTALHFWYDFLLTGTFFVLDPQDSPLSATATFRF